MMRPLLAVALAVTLGTVGCAAPDRAIDPVPAGVASSVEAASASSSEEPSPFRRFNLGANYEIEHFTSMKDLVSKSDLVIVGTVTGAHWGHEYRDVETDESGTDTEIARSLVYEVGIDRGLRGTPVGLKQGAVDVVMDVVDPPFALDAPVGAKAVFFLRQVGAPIPGVNPTPDPEQLARKIYRPVSSLGVLDEDRGHLAFPMGGGADWAVDFLDESWDRAVQHLVSISTS